MRRFSGTVYVAIVGLILFCGFAAQIYAADSGLTEVVIQEFKAYPTSSQPLKLTYQIDQGTDLGAIPKEKLNEQKTGLAEAFDIILEHKSPKGSHKLDKDIEVQKETSAEGYRLLGGTTVKYELPEGNYKVTIPKGTQIILKKDPPSAQAKENILAVITPPEHFQITLTVDPQTIVERIPGASVTGATLQVQPSRAPLGGYINLEVAKSDFDFTKAQFYVSLRKPGKNKPFIASDDVELKEVQIGKAKLQVRIPSKIKGISGIHWAEPVDLLVVARGPDDKRAEVLDKEFKVSSWFLALIYGIGALLISWLVLALVTKKFKNPIWFVAGKDGGASLSLAQILLWTILVFSASLYVLEASGKLLDLTNDVLILLGIAGGVSVIAKITASTKDEKGLAIATSTPTPTPTPILAATPTPTVKTPNWLELFQTDGQADLYKFQMALFTLLAAVFVTGKIVGTLEFPVLPAGLLTLIGISNGVYLAAKGATKTLYEKLGEKSDELHKATEELQQRQAEAVKATMDLNNVKPAKEAAHQRLTEIQRNLDSESDRTKQGEPRQQLEQQKMEYNAAADNFNKAEQKQKDADAAKTAAERRVDQLQKEFNDLRAKIPS